MVKNLPFDIPKSWCWARLGSIIDLLSGRDLEPESYNNNSKGIPYITGASNFENKHLQINRWTESPVVVSILGDLLITCKGTIGTMACNNIGEVHIARQVMAIRTTKILGEYINVYLETQIQQLQSVSKSMIPGISRADIENALISIPPYNEQRQICEKIKTIVDIIKNED